MTTRQEYNHKNLTGPDADILTSLGEYGLAWIETKTDILFYYGIAYDDDLQSFTRFDFCTIDKSIDVFTEYDWADFNTIGEDITDAVLLDQVQMLLNQYGYENIFGTSYHDGLELHEITGDYSLKEEQLLNHFDENLSGSGIDSYWESDSLKTKPHVIILSNSYHVMNENGYYDGYLDFKIRIDINKPYDFMITYGKDKRQYIPLLDDMLGDQVHHEIEKLFPR